MSPIAQIIEDNAHTDPDAPAITCGSTSISRNELEEWSNAVAASFEGHGVDEGDFVTLALPNSVEFYVAAIAAWKLGAVPQPISYRLPRRERDAIIELAEPALVVGLAPDECSGVPCVPAQLGRLPDITVPPVRPVRTSPAWKAPTSGGSTGRPKIIVSGQSGDIDPMTGARYGMERDDVQLVPGPLYHNGPFTVSMMGLFMGHHLVVMERFDAAEALRLIDDHHVTWVNLVPTMMQRMVRAIDGGDASPDLGSLRQVWHMAAPCPEWLKRRWIDLVGGATLMELYGGTEAQAVCIVDGREWLRRPGTVGKVAIGEMQVQDEEGHPVRPGTIGEIFMRPAPGDPSTYRYIGAQARTRGTWESLGDLGWMDPDGYVFLSDRRTDLIISGGANIYPAEVEAALSEHPAVQSCVVVGLPDDDMGQRVHAVVQSLDPALTGSELTEHMSDRLAQYKLPRSYRFVNEPLRDDAGKTRRSQVRDREIELRS